MNWLLGIPAVVVLMGGVLALFWHPSHRARSLIQHFAAGVVLAALAVEVLPELQREHAPGWVLIGAFMLGGLVMFGLKVWTEGMERRAEASQARGINHGLVAATMIDVAVDGALIGAGFAAGGSTGLILAAGLSVELLFLGLALASETMKGGKMLAATSVMALILLGSILLGVTLLDGAPKAVISAILAFGVAALLYLVTDELLVEAHTIEEKPSSTLWLFAGFLVFWAIQLYA